jgi:hypothetical protein
MFITSYAQVKNKMKLACYDPTTCLEDIASQKNSSLNLFRVNQHSNLGLDAIMALSTELKELAKTFLSLKE